jgi:DNA-binding NarL/FixJ family response regulator
MSYSRSVDRRPGDKEVAVTWSDEVMTTATLARPTSTTTSTNAGTTGTTGGGLPDQLTRRELEVLALMAEGRSNRAIGEQLTVELKTVETHVSSVFTKLGLNEDPHGNRRVLAVLRFLVHSPVRAG